MFKNQVSQYGRYVVTEEVNCYIVWESHTTTCRHAIYYNNESAISSDKDAAFSTAKNFADRLNKRDTQ